MKAQKVDLRASGFNLGLLLHGFATIQFCESLRLENKSMSQQEWVSEDTFHKRITAMSDSPFQKAWAARRQREKLAKSRGEVWDVAKNSKKSPILNRDSNCPNGTLKLASSDVEIVVNTMLENLDWLQRNDAPTYVYVHNRTTQPSHCYTPDIGYDDAETCGLPDSQVIASAQESQRSLEASNPDRKYPIEFMDIPNVGDEASAYLNHIIRRYHNLPKALVFLHGHDSHWHAPGSMSDKLQYTCFDPNMGLKNLNVKSCLCISDTEDGGFPWLPDYVFHKNWDLFQDVIGDRPSRICWDCCAQFAVSREAILKHPISFYEKLLKRVLNGMTTMEYEWRMLFVDRKVVGACESES